MALDWVVTGGFVCGAMAGSASRLGRLCTMSAIEDALVGGDRRGLKAWGLALAVAILATQAVQLAGLVDLSASRYAAVRTHLLGAGLGGAMFGLGMTLVGTCSFGLLVRAGGGDLRAGLSALIVGIAAVATTAGVLSMLRLPLLDIGVVDLTPAGGPNIDGILVQALGALPAYAVLAVLVGGIVAAAVLDARLRRRRRLMLAAVTMGLAVGASWLVTGQAVEALLLGRPEALSFVAPAGRALLQLMIEPRRGVGFGVAAMVGVVGASLAVAWWREELRWEAFDDAREMRRHLVGGVLMGAGGVLGQGCTIGQALSGGSALAVTAPLFLAGVFAGAWLGLRHLIEGRALWRLGRS